jgi:hypothetical protein
MRPQIVTCASHSLIQFAVPATTVEPPRIGIGVPGAACPTAAFPDLSLSRPGNRPRDR